MTRIAMGGNADNGPDGTAVEEETAEDLLARLPDLGPLLAAAAERVVDGVEASDFIAWFVTASSRIAPVFDETLLHTDDELRRAGFARGLWNRFPQPSNRFRPRPLPAPKRNDPCLCGSGRKYKQCCLAHEPARTLIDRLPLLLHVLDRYPDEALDALETTAMEPDDFLHVLDTWAAEGDGQRVVRLALSMFTAGKRLPRHAPEALEILLASWPHGFRERDFTALLETLAEHADTEIAVIALGEQVRARHAADGAAGWALFRRALERFGEDPGLASLEIDLLVGEGREEEAVATAESWRTRLLTRDPAFEEFADALLARATWIDPELALERARDSDDVLDRLVTLLDETPPGPVAGTHALPAPSREAASGRALVLAPTPALTRVENAWRTRRDGRHSLDDDLTEIVSWLDDEPLALSSFDIIQSLATSLDDWAEACWAEAVFVRLLERAESLLYRHVSRELGFETPEGLPDWDAMVWETAPEVAWRHRPNRAALDLLAGLAGWYRDIAAEGGGGADRADTLDRALAGLDPDRGRWSGGAHEETPGAPAPPTSPERTR